MKPEDHLDQLIELHKSGDNRPLLLDAESRELLDAAARLTQLRSINVPSSFERKLEQELRARVRTQKIAKLNQSGQLLPPAPVPGSTRAVHLLKRQAWAAIICLVALLLIICTGLLVSGQGFPGNPFKQTAHPGTPHLSQSTQDPANAAIQQLYSSLSDLKTVVNERRSDDAIQHALNAVAEWTRTSQQEAATPGATSATPATEQKLAQGIAQEKQTLHLLLSQVDWSMKLAFTHQLGVLREPVPTVTAANAHLLSSGNTLVTLTGSNFSLKAQFLVNGKPMGNISQRTTHSLVALIGDIEHLTGTHTVGILNPDGTAAQTTTAFPKRVNGPGTPTPTPTHRPDE